MCCFPPRYIFCCDLGRVLSHTANQNPLAQMVFRPDTVSLLDLPPEIVCIILRELLVTPTSIDLWNLSYDWRAQVPLQSLGIHPGILRTARALNEEGSRTLYGRNTFRVTVLLHPHDRNVWRHRGGTPYSIEPHFRNIDWLPECHYFYTFEQLAGKTYPLGQLTMELKSAELGVLCWTQPTMRLNTLFDDICRWLSESRQLPRVVVMQSATSWELSDWYEVAGRCEEFSSAIARLMCEYSQWHLQTLSAIVGGRTTLLTNVKCMCPPGQATQVRSCRAEF
jgi:hypothetical protein